MALRLSAREAALVVVIVTVLCVSGGSSASATSSAAEPALGGHGMTAAPHSAAGSFPARSDGAATPASPTPSPTATSVPADPSFGGLLNVSGLTSEFLWARNPIHSAAELSFVVRNGSKATFDATARFWADTTFGSRVREVSGIEIRALKPGETRTVRATLRGLGQWAVLHAHATLTPPTTLDGTEIAAVSRDSFVVVPPILAGGLALGLAVALVSVKFLWFRRRTGVIA